MKTIFIKPLSILIALTCLVVITYFGIMIYKELTPPSYNDQKMQCLELGSNLRYRQCMQMINQK